MITFGSTRREAVLLSALCLLLVAHVGLHGYAIVKGVPPAAQIKWTVLVPIWSLFSLLHAWHALGWRRLLWLLGIVVSVSFFFEYVGVKTGAPFGRYFYTDELGPKLAGTVPFIIPFAYFMMLYPSHVITNLVLDGQAVSTIRRWQGIVAAAVLTALVMTAWDLTTDPVMANEVHAWTWVDGGPYFGIPLENFRGWTLVVALICIFYRFVELRVPLRPIGRSERWITMLPLIGYGTMALGDALVGTPIATRLIPPFAMGAPLLAAAVRLADSGRTRS